MQLVKINHYMCMCMLCNIITQCARKVVSDSPGLVDFAIRLVNSVFNLSDGQGMYFEEFCFSKSFWG